jgi:hypothetical protein
MASSYEARPFTATRRCRVGTISANPLDEGAAPPEGLVPPELRPNDSPTCQVISVSDTTNTEREEHV